MLWIHPATAESRPFTPSFASVVPSFNMMAESRPFTPSEVAKLPSFSCGDILQHNCRRFRCNEENFCCKGNVQDELHTSCCFVAKATKPDGGLLRPLVALVPWIVSSTFFPLLRLQDPRRSRQVAGLKSVGAGRRSIQRSISKPERGKVIMVRKAKHPQKSISRTKY